MPEIARKIYRMLGLLFPILYFIYTKKVMLVIILISLGVFVLYELLRFSFPQLNKLYFRYLKIITKKKEKKAMTGTTYLLISFFFTILLFKKNIAIAAMTFSVVGDAASSLIGKKFGKTKLISKPKKTFEGSTAFFISSLIAGLIFVYFGLEINYIVMFMGILAATIAEILPFSIDDNLTISIISGLAMSLMLLI